MSVAEELERKLGGAKFRVMNEKMYKKKALTAEEAQKYHEYYMEQARKWPQNPRDVVVAKLNENPDRGAIADIGCGGASIGRIFPNVTSYDRYPMDGSVVLADLEAIPAGDKAFDTAVHVLSIMQGYISKVIMETNRILRTGGLWYIAEVRSRITNVHAFINRLERFGFKLSSVDVSNTHFCIIVLKKTGDCHFEKKIPEVRLKPCLYKRR